MSSDATYNVAADELTPVHRNNTSILESRRKKTITEQQKRGHVRSQKVAAMTLRWWRNWSPCASDDKNDLDEEEAILDLYKAALGMAW